MVKDLYKKIMEAEENDGVELIDVDGLGQVEIVYVNEPDMFDDYIEDNLGFALYGKNKILLREDLKENPGFLEYVKTHEIFELLYEPGNNKEKHTEVERKTLNYLREVYEQDVLNEDIRGQAYELGVGTNLEKYDDIKAGTEQAEFTTEFYITELRDMVIRLTQSYLPENWDGTITPNEELALFKRAKQGAGNIFLSADAIPKRYVN
ncbi:MAG: hypothetical protein ABIF08_01965 [Nanoarchaeota archaeon]